jgi:hypothetical protein
MIQLFHSKYYLYYYPIEYSRMEYEIQDFVEIFIPFEFWESLILMLFCLLIFIFIYFEKQVVMQLV